MKLYRFCAAAALLLFAFAGAGTASADPKGLWLAQDGARVRVGPCGAALCANIATPKLAVDPETGRPCDRPFRGEPGSAGQWLPCSWKLMIAGSLPKSRLVRTSLPRGTAA